MPLLTGNKPALAAGRRRAETAVVIAALATLPVVMLEAQGFVHWGIDAADWGIWLVFIGALTYNVATTARPLEYLRRNPLDLLIVAVSFPVLPSALALSRLLRVVRLARVVFVAGRALPGIRVIFGRRELIAVAALCAFMVLAAASAIALLEPETVDGDLSSALWWALVTITTVGYGDIAPTTPAARLVAVVLMICGLGLISTLSASIAAFFVGQQRQAATEEVYERLLKTAEKLEATAQNISEQIARNPGD